MGWNSGVYIFDAVIAAAYQLQNHYLDQQAMPDPKGDHAAMVQFAKVVRDELEAGDWDSQQESDFWLDLAPDLWPGSYKKYLEYEND